MTTKKRSNQAQWERKKDEIERSAIERSVTDHTWATKLEIDEQGIAAPIDEHFGQRLVAALQALPDEMKNDPAYADPVAWVKRARENNAPPDDSDSE